MLTACAPRTAVDRHSVSFTAADLPREVLDQGLDLVVAIDPAEMVTFVSRASLRMLLRCPAEIVGSRLAELIHIDDLQVVRRRLLADADAPPVTCRLRQLDGHWRPLECAGRRIDAGGRAMFVLYLRDVVDRSEVEGQLVAAQAAAAVAQTARAIIHDYNNLLFIMSASLELLEPDVPLSAMEQLSTMRQALSSASALGRQLLACAGRSQQMEPKAIDVNASIGELRGLLVRLAGRGVAVDYDLRAPRGVVTLPPSCLDQLFLNLVSNARDAMPNGGRIRIRTRDAGGDVLIEVTDDGVGMTDDVRRKIFEPFFTTKAPGRGTGLGLPTVMAIVQRAGGRIVVDSEEGLGTTFRLLLPRHRPARRPAPPTDAS